MSVGFLIGIVLVLTSCSFSSVNKDNSSQSKFLFSKNIWKSIDGGKTWQVKNKGVGKASTTSSDVLSIVINPYDNQNIFVGLRQGGIMESKDGGESWQFINFHSAKVYGLVLDPNNPRIIYASGVFQGRGKIFKSDDEGKKWQEIYTSPSLGPLIISLMIDPHNAKVIYATNSINEIFKSVDGGVSWKNIYLAKAPIIKMAIDMKNSQLIYAITNSGVVYRSKNGGANFEELNKNISQSLNNSNYIFNDLKISKIHSCEVYLGGKGGIIRSKDAGEHWQKVVTLNNPERFPVNALAINPKNDNDLIYGAAQATYQSNDSGSNWVTFQFNTKMLVRTLVYDPINPKIVYLGFTKK